MSIESMMPFNHLILCPPLLLLPSIFPSIRVFSIEPALRIRWPYYWSFSFTISPSNEYSGLISFNPGLISLLSKGLSRVWESEWIKMGQSESPQDCQTHQRKDFWGWKQWAWSCMQPLCYHVGRSYLRIKLNKAKTYREVCQYNVNTEHCLDVLGWVILCWWGLCFTL